MVSECCYQGLPLHLLLPCSSRFACDTYVTTSATQIPLPKTAPTLLRVLFFVMITINMAPSKQAPIMDTDIKRKLQCAQRKIYPNKVAAAAGLMSLPDELLLRIYEMVVRTARAKPPSTKRRIRIARNQVCSSVFVQYRRSRSSRA